MKHSQSPNLSSYNTRVIRAKKQQIERLANPPLWIFAASELAIWVGRLLAAELEVATAEVELPFFDGALLEPGTEFDA